MGGYFSQASNFTGEASDKVDPRTGLFSSSLHIMDVHGNDLTGPTFPLTLNYAPFTGRNCGLGAGWSFNWTEYDTRSRTLFASTGERYKTAGELATLQQHKLRTIDFTRDGNTAYRLAHRSGVIEVLKGDNNAFAVKVPESIYSPNGVKLSLDWTDEFSTEYRIKQIQDGNGIVLLKVDYSNRSRPTMIVWPDSAESHTLIFSLDSSGQLSTMTNGDAEWRFTYDANISTDTPPLTAVAYPGGLTETVWYTKEGHKFPEGDTSPPPLPYVHKYVREPQGGSPEMEYRYAFSAKNFLGYGSGVRYNPDKDNLLSAPLGDYQYTSTVSLMAGATEAVVIHRVYDNFHLMQNETTTQGANTRTKTLEYYANSDASWNYQPDIYQFPKRVTTRYSQAGGSREEQQLTEFDATGNITSRTDVDGTVTTWTYYPGSGESKLCPQQFNTVTGLLLRKTETVTPPPSDFSTPVRSTQMTYVALEKATSDAPFLYTVVPSVTDSFEDGRLIHSQTQTYLDAPALRDHGKPLSTREIFFSGTVACTGTTDYRYEYDDEEGTVRTISTFTGSDSISTFTLSETLSVRSGLTLLKENRMGVKTRYTYDCFGRELTQTSACDTDYAQTTTTDYRYAALSPDSRTKLLQMTVTGYRGDMTQSWYDGAGHTIREARFSSDTGEWYTTAEYQYDGKWQISIQMDSDVIFSPPAKPVTVSHEMRYTYDDWGELAGQTGTDGAVVAWTNDPVSLSLSETRNDSGATRLTLYDVWGMPLMVTTTEAGGREAVSRMRYDGLQRLRGLIDENGAETRYEYDAWDRVCTITYADGTTVTQTYAPLGNSERLVDSIAVNDQLVGYQTFDALQRCIRTVCGGRTTMFRYSGANPAPSTVKLPDGTPVSLTYNPALGVGKIIRCVADNIRKEFSWDKATGELLLAQESFFGGVTTLSLRHNDSGLPVEERVWQGSGDGAAVATSSRYTLLGRPLGYTDSGGVERLIQYDRLGRPVGGTYDGMECELQYDAYGQLAGWTTGKLTVELTLDSLGREVGRALVNKDEGSTLILTMGWGASGLLSRRDTALTRRDGDGGEVSQGALTETFTYDRCNRLVLYTGQGKLAPRDRYGHAMTRQEFTFDALSNVTGLLTTLDGQVDNATFYYENPADPCQLSRVTHTHPDYPDNIVLSYDACGRLLRDEIGAQMQYDDLGRLSAGGLKEQRALYSYDALNRLFSQTDEVRREFRYERGALITQTESGGNGENMVRWLRAVGGVVADSRRQDGQRRLRFYGHDHKGTVLATYENGGATYRSCTSYGEYCVPDEQANRPGYNGERFDTQMSAYHLGNGYRTYHPGLMRFNAPDNLSPFGAGGVNPYAYCIGDPINHIDPSGHKAWQIVVLSISVLASITGAVFGFGTGLTKLTAREATLATRVFGSMRMVAATTGLTDMSLIVASYIEGTETDSFQVNTKDGPITYDNGKAALSNRLSRAAMGMMVATALFSLPDIAMGTYAMGKKIKKGGMKKLFGTDTASVTDGAAPPSGSQQRRRQGGQGNLGGQRGQEQPQRGQEQPQRGQLLQGRLGITTGRSGYMHFGYGPKSNWKRYPTDE